MVQLINILGQQVPNGMATAEELPAEGLAYLQGVTCAMQVPSRAPVPSQPVKERWQRMSRMRMHDAQHYSRTSTAEAAMAPGSPVASKLEAVIVVPPRACMRGPAAPKDSRHGGSCRAPARVQMVNAAATSL